MTETRNDNVLGKGIFLFWMVAPALAFMLHPTVVDFVPANLVRLLVLIGFTVFGVVGWRLFVANERVTTFARNMTIGVSGIVTALYVLIGFFADAVYTTWAFHGSQKWVFITAALVTIAYLFTVQTEDDVIIMEPDTTVIDRDFNTRVMGQSSV